MTFFPHHNSYTNIWKMFSFHTAAEINSNNLQFFKFSHTDE